MVQFNEADICAEFKVLCPKLEEWGKEVDAVLEGILRDLALSHERVQHRPSHRVKDEASYVQKAIYRNKNYERPILNITDKVGTRIVLLNIDDVNAVSKCIKESDAWFFVDQAQDIDYIREHKPTEFIYQSNHFIVKPKPGKYTEDECELLTCEIQVRTLLQHAYAETSHDTVYKKGHSDDPQVLRSLAVTMAFLETADDKIKLIYKKTGEITSPKPQLIEMMIALYGKLVGSYDASSLDAGMTESLLSLFNDDFYSVALAELPGFIDKHSEDIIVALCKEKKSILFLQPIVLMAFYAILKVQQQVMSNWPFSHESLLEVCRAMNISEDAIV